MELRLYPDPVLRRRAEAVRAFDPALADVARGMVRLMHDHKGLGLAAPQAGLSLRLMIVVPDDAPDHETVMVNPEIVQTGGWEEAEEGCLSFPGIYIKNGRFARLRVRYQNLQGNPCQGEAEGLLARAVQHEVDHLDGRLLVDRMSVVQRLTHRRRLRELERRFEEQQGKAMINAK